MPSAQSGGGSGGGALACSTITTEADCFQECVWNAAEEECYYDSMWGAPTAEPQEFPVMGPASEPFASCADYFEDEDACWDNGCMYTAAVDDTMPGVCSDDSSIPCDDDSHCDQTIGEMCDPVAFQCQQQACTTDSDCTYYTDQYCDNGSCTWIYYDSMWGAPTAEPQEFPESGAPTAEEIQQACPTEYESCQASG
eukprot:COSAG02_NODE_8653_length_2485_cov_2.233054_1_plen_195_part_10